MTVEHMDSKALANYAPMTFEEVQELKVGDKVVCLNRGDYNRLIAVGGVYPVREVGDYGPIIEDETGDDLGFLISDEDAHLFAKVQQVSQVNFFTMAVRALDAEAKLEAARKCIEEELNGVVDSEFHLGIKTACMDIAKLLGFKIEPARISVIKAD